MRSITVIRISSQSVDGCAVGKSFRNADHVYHPVQPGPGDEAWRNRDRFCRGKSRGTILEVLDVETALRSGSVFWPGTDGGLHTGRSVHSSKYRHLSERRGYSYFLEAVTGKQGKGRAGRGK